MPIHKDGLTLLQRAAKRLFDIVFAGLGMVFLAPVLFAMAVYVKFTSPGPVFFRQKRVGRNGKLFSVVKFRTMYVGSEAGGFVTAEFDDRITPAGRVLRQYKLDELPQLWNVFFGVMSFVGPRPDVPGYADKLEGDGRKILSLRPGITGPASLYFRDEEQQLASSKDPHRYNDTVLWPKKVELNLEYLEHWSLWKDIGYIVVTLVPEFDSMFNLVKREI